MDATGKVDVSLASTDELVAELIKRHDSIVFAGIIFRTQQQYSTIRKYSGHRHACLGLLSNMESLINSEVNGTLRPTIE